jgi:hypothetical protein
MKGYEVLTSPEAVKTYRSIVRLVVLVAMVAWWLVLVIRDAGDRYVQSCIEVIPDVDISDEDLVMGLQKGEAPEIPDVDISDEDIQVDPRLVEVGPARQFTIRQLKRAARAAKVRGYSNMKSHELKFELMMKGYSEEAIASLCES